MWARRLIGGGSLNWLARAEQAETAASWDLFLSTWYHQNTARGGPRFEQPLIKECTLTHNKKPYMIWGRFRNYGLFQVLRGCSWPTRVSFTVFTSCSNTAPTKVSATSTTPQNDVGNSLDIRFICMCMYIYIHMHVNI